jgi:hypothetical protein
MLRVAAGTAMFLLLGTALHADDAPQALLDRFLASMKSELDRLPNCVCNQTVERLERPSADQAWRKIDTLHLEVALTSEGELYARTGARRFDQRSLAQIVGKGTVTTGQFGMFAKHVFLMSSAKYGFRGEAERDGRKAYEYFYEVDPARSSYKLRSGNLESVAGFQGSFWIDPVTLDLLRLEVQAFDISPALGLSEVNTSLSYSRITIRNEQFLIPIAATLAIVAADGTENLNRMKLAGCRVYQAESALQGEAVEAPAPAPARPAEPAPLSLPSTSLLELALDAPLDPSRAEVGHSVRARVSRSLSDSAKVIIPQGALVAGRITRIEKQTQPFPVFEIGIEFETLEIDNRQVPFAATMIEAGPAAGLLRQTKRMDPTFSKNRSARMDVLVREVQRGQGILLWDARRGPIPAGLRMKWRLQEK